uniref:GATA transcription factor n=1 Tax=Kalanchoe fedtschenkoi TaxID=63787 RepID=A0A7N0TD98_KALFE
MDEFFRVDDLLNFSNDDHVFSSITTDHSDHHHHHHHHLHQNQQLNSSSEHMVDYQLKNYYDRSNNLPRCNNSSFSSVSGPAAAAAAAFGAQHFSYEFTDQLCVPNDDVAELEWLSNFVDDSFNDFNSNALTGTLMSQSHTSIPSAARSKRSRQRTWKASTSLISSSTAPQIDRSRTKRQETNSMSEFVDDSSSSSGGVRRCSHCASEKTPQWRTGPMGPKTLCNACGVRYKSGRLVPEYRPAASPTFVLTQHSNSHRKVMELRRQKEVTIKQQQGHVYRHSHDFEVC